MDSSAAEIKKEIKNKTSMFTGTRLIGEAPEIEKFLFNKTTDLEDIFEYMNDLKCIITLHSFQNDVLSLRFKVLKKLKILKTSLMILRNARKHGFDPCIVCLNKQYCSAVCALLSGEEKEETEIDDDCMISEKCQISDLELGLACKMTEIGLLKKLIIY